MSTRSDFTNGTRVQMAGGGTGTVIDNHKTESIPWVVVEFDNPNGGSGGCTAMPIENLTIIGSPDR